MSGTLGTLPSVFVYDNIYSSVQTLKAARLHEAMHDSFVLGQALAICWKNFLGRLKINIASGVPRSAWERPLVVKQVNGFRSSA